MKKSPRRNPWVSYFICVDLYKNRLNKTTLDKYKYSMDTHDYIIRYNQLLHAHRDKIRDLETILSGQRFASFVPADEAKSELVKALRDYADFLENPPKKK